MKLFADLQTSGAIYPQVQPNLANRFEMMASRDPAYLLHEYNHSDWQPQYADQVIRQAAALDLDFLGSASLPEGFLGLLPEPFRPLLSQQSDPGRRELVRDLLTNQAFRRDVYVKGRDPLWTGEANRRLRSLELILQSPLPEPHSEGANSFQLAWGEVRGNSTWFDVCLGCLSEGPRTIGSLEERLRQPGQPTPTPELLQNIALLLPAALQGAQGDALAAALADNLSRLQRSLRKEEQPLQDEALRQEITTIAAGFERDMLPRLRLLQAIA